MSSFTLARLLIVLPIVASIAAPQQAGKKEPARGNADKAQAGKSPGRTPLTSIEAVTDIDAPRDPDDPGAGGGVDAAGYFARRLAAKVVACTTQIRTTADGWAKGQNLVASKIDQQPGDLLMHLGKPDLDGFFELTYRVRLQEERARVTLFFYTADGSRRDPGGIKQMLKDYHIAMLQDDLTKALLCGN
jgi:hypothetical protein